MYVTRKCSEERKHLKVEFEIVSEKRTLSRGSVYKKKKILYKYSFTHNIFFFLMVC